MFTRSRKDAKGRARADVCAWRQLQGRRILGSGETPRSAFASVLTFAGIPAVAGMTWGDDEEKRIARADDEQDGRPGISEPAEGVRWRAARDRLLSGPFADGPPMLRHPSERWDPGPEEARGPASARCGSSWRFQLSGPIEMEFRWVPFAGMTRGGEDGPGRRTVDGEASMGVGQRFAVDDEGRGDVEGGSLVARAAGR